MTKTFHPDEPTSINKTRSWKHVMWALLPPLGPAEVFLSVTHTQISRYSTRSERLAKARLAFVLLPEKTGAQLETRGSPLHDISTHVRPFCRRIGWLIRCGADPVLTSLNYGAQWEDWNRWTLSKVNFFFYLCENHISENESLYDERWFSAANNNESKTTKHLFYLSIYFIYLSF